MQDKSPLSNDKVNDAIDQACKETTQRQKSSGGISFIRFQQKHVEQYSEFFENGSMIQNPSMVLAEENNIFAFVIFEKEQVLAFVSFYLSYSTWDGRMLYLDSVQRSSVPQQECHQGDGGGDASSLPSPLFDQEIPIYYTLADIALKLDCHRLSWQHNSPCPVFPGNAVPETLKGWLILHQSLTSSSSSSSSSSSLSLQGGQQPQQQQQNSQEPRLYTALLRQKLQETLAKLPGNSKEGISLRLATVDDIPQVERLVHGLAVYEKEPDAVHITADHFRRDGFDSDPPLFYTFLMQDGGAVVGMAFCFVACKRLSSTTFGRFLYLEDLFIEETSRGKGIGSKVMKWLAHDIAANIFDCSRMEWTALHWNTPALTFYDKKIGAKVQEGLEISRFAGDALHSFVTKRPAQF